MVDDEWLTVGSANLNEHSLFNDTEVNLVTDDSAVARSVRESLWSEHLGEDCTGRDPIDVIEESWRPALSRTDSTDRALRPLPHVSRRSARLLDAQAKAAELFADVEARGLIAPGIGERQASDAIRDLAADMFGIGGWWHKRIVRAGPNTLQPYRENPPDRVIGADDIVFCDFGPIFEE